MAIERINYSFEIILRHSTIRFLDQSYRCNIMNNLEFKYTKNSFKIKIAVFYYGY